MPYTKGKNEVITELRREFEPKGMKVFPISAVSRQGLKELLYYVKELLDNMDDTPIVYEQEFFPDSHSTDKYTIEISPEDGAYVVEGPKIDKMLGYTNIESEKGFLFFQNFLKQQGILKELEKRGYRKATRYVCTD